MAYQYLKAVIKSNTMEKKYLSEEHLDSVGSPCTTSNASEEEDVEGDTQYFDTGDTMGLRSPNGAMRGRSVKEYEEQMTTLKKENFNLKLRIYFLEEKLGTNFTLDKDNVVKKNIELKVEIANLQKELQEKHELLCQAVKAMELEDDEHKKYVQEKDEILGQYKQELEDLRVQLQETKFESDGMSHKSDPSGYFSCRAFNAHGSNDHINDLQGKIHLLENELTAEKQNNASLQLLLDQTEALKTRFENLQEESELKEEKINNLNEALNEANEKELQSKHQLKALEHKLEDLNVENKELRNKVTEQSKAMDELLSQIAEFKKKYTAAKIELERDHKKMERSKMISEMKITELEEENEKQKIKIRDLHAKLEAALLEVKKNQNLAVFKISNPATPYGTPKANSLPVQVTTPQSHPSPIHTPSTPENLNIHQLEMLLRGESSENISIQEIISDIKLLRNDYNAQKQKIVKLKAEQIKACQIIKNMMDSRTKASEEISSLKTKITELERELESVVSKPDRAVDGATIHSQLSELNITAASGDNEKSMAGTPKEDFELAEHYKALMMELENKIEVLVATLNEKDSQMQNFRDQYEALAEILQDKDNRIVDLEFELLSLNQKSRNPSRTSLEKLDEEPETANTFKEELEEKEREISRLNSELKKCTCYLQEIVNKELWEKNREIEKLHNKQGQNEILHLKKSLLGKEMQLKVLKEKICELGLDISIPADLQSDSFKLYTSFNSEDIRKLKEKLELTLEEKKHLEKLVEELTGKINIYEREDKEEMLNKLKEQNLMLQDDIMKCEKMRLESNELCSILSSRLEELAIFLDSLLRQKSVLGFLGIQKNKRLREIIDSSLDLSRSFTMSMMINPDQSLAQLSDISNLLNGSIFQDLSNKDLPEEDSNEVSLSIIPSGATLTYQSHLNRENSGTKESEPNNEQVILALREQIVNLKCELQLRDVELNKLSASNTREFSDKVTETERETEDDFYCKEIGKVALTSNKSSNTTSTTLKYQTDNQSESESWSEPDRDVSRARIGLNQSLPLISKPKKLSSNESTDDNCVHSLSPSKRNAWLLNRNNVIDLNRQLYDIEDQLRRKTVDLKKTEHELDDTKKNSRKHLENLEEKLKDTEEKLIQAEAKKIESECKVQALQDVVNELTNLKKELEENLEIKDKETQDNINQLEAEKEAALKTASNLERQVSDAKNEIISAETKISNMQHEFKELESILRKEYEELTIKKLKVAEEEFVKQLKEIEHKAQLEIKQFEIKVNEMEKEFSENYIKKSEVDHKLLEIKKYSNEIQELRETKSRQEELIEEFQIKDLENREKVQEFHEKLNSLRKDLDNLTVQYSEAVLERTKLVNEKTKLEQEFNKLCMKESDLKQQFSDIQSELNSMKQSCQQQVSLLQNQKSKLEVKVSELESFNAELHNRLIKIQTRGELSTSLPARFYDTGKSVLPFKRHYSDNAHYSSEDNYEDMRERNASFNRSLARNVPHGDTERQEANSSPDLGIESDHGRFSSLETHLNVPCPILQTVELTESMSNLLDGENNQIEGVNCGGEHCCERVLEISNENHDLKKQLSKTRRALEETMNQLNLANQRKKQVEKTIYKQIHKTSQVLRKAKANLDSGSETDMYKL